MNHNFKARFASIAMVVAIILGAFALTTPTAFAAGSTLTVYAPAGKTQVYDAPAGRAIYGDYVTGDVSVDLYAVDEQGGIWFRLGDGTQPMHPVGEVERWTRYASTRNVADHNFLPALKEVYSLPKVTWTIEQRAIGKVRMRIVEEPVKVQFADGADQFAQMSGDLKWTTRPQYLTVFRIPEGRKDLRLYGVGGDCVARVNGVEQTLATTSDLVLNPSDKVTVVGAICGIFSADNVGLDITAVKRSFSGVILQANLAGFGGLLVLLILVGYGLYEAWRRRKLAFVLQVSVIALTIGGIALAATAPVYAGPQPPGGPQGTETPTPTPTGPTTEAPAATETPTVEGTPVPEATAEAPVATEVPATEAPAETETETPTAEVLFSISGGHLWISRDGGNQWVDLGLVEGDPGLGIKSAVVDANGDLIVTFTDDTSMNAGRVKDTDGIDAMITVNEVVEACVNTPMCVEAIADAVIAKQAQATPVPAEPVAPPAPGIFKVVQLALLIAVALVAIGLIVILIRRRLFSYEEAPPPRPSATPDLKVEETPADANVTLRRPGGQQ